MTKTPRGVRNDEARMKFAAWLALPVAQRQPKTQRALAKQLGVRHATLSQWRRHPAVQGVVKEWRESYRAQFVEVVESLYRQARKGNVPAARLLAEVLGELAPSKSEVNVTETPLGQLLTELRDLRRKPLEVIEGGKKADSA